MKALARAIVNAAAYLELACEDGVDSESALQALEEIAYNLSYCTDEEKQTLAEVLADMRAAELESGPRPEMLEFLDTFLASFGLVDHEEPGEPPSPPRINLL
jgi:hypothetical protein